MYSSSKADKTNVGIGSHESGYLWGSEENDWKHGGNFWGKVILFLDMDTNYTGILTV